MVLSLLVAVAVPSRAADLRWSSDARSLAVAEVPAGQRVSFFAAAEAGAHCLTATATFSDVCLGLAHPVLLGTAVAAPDGVATLVVGRRAERAAVFQAAVTDHTSNTVVRPGGAVATWVTAR